MSNRAVKIVVGAVLFAAAAFVVVAESVNRSQPEVWDLSKPKPASWSK